MRLQRQMLAKNLRIDDVLINSKSVKWKTIPCIGVNGLKLDCIRVDSLKFYYM